MRLFALENSPLLPAKLLQFFILLLCIPPRQMLLKIKQLCILNCSINFWYILNRKACLHLSLFSHYSTLYTSYPFRACILALQIQRPMPAAGSSLVILSTQTPHCWKAGEQIKPHLIQSNQALLLVNWELRQESHGIHSHSEACKTQQLQAYIPDNRQIGVQHLQSVR